MREKPITEAREAFSTLAKDPAPILIVWSDAVVYANPPLLELLGLTDSERILGDPLETWIADESVSALKRMISGPPDPYRTSSWIPVTFKRSTGEAIATEVRISAARFDEKMANHILVRPMAALNAIAEEFQSASRADDISLSVILDEFPNPIVKMGSTGECDGVSSSWTEFCGRSLTDSRGGGWLDAIQPLDRESFLREKERAQQEKRPYECQMRLRRHDGIYRWQLFRAMPRRRENGILQGWLGIFTEIEDQKLAEKALRRAEKLDTAERMAAVIAHEVNNPLTAVSNLLYLMDDGNLPERSMQYLLAAQRELSRAIKVVTQNLRFHRQQTLPAPARIPAIVDAALSTFDERMRLSGLQVVREYAVTSPLNCWDADLHQVFAVVIANAMEAMSSTGKKLVIRVTEARLRSRHHGAAGIRVTFADTGVGMSEEVRAQAFEPFYSTKGITGTGLGLWIARSIVQRHGGTIQLRSSNKTGQSGTVVRIFLPFQRESTAFPSVDAGRTSS